MAGNDKILLLSDIKNSSNSKSLNQVKWVRDNLDGYLNFYSVSGDGRVTNWTLVKNCLWHSDQLTISFAKQLTNLAEAELGKWVSNWFQIQKCKMTMTVYCVGTSWIVEDRLPSNQTKKTYSWYIYITMLIFCLI